MLVPANRRNPVRVAAEGALALASAAERGYRMVESTLQGAKNLGIIRGNRGARRVRHDARQQQVGRAQPAPVTLGYAIRPNQQGLPRICSFAGMKGIAFTGSQMYCLIRSAAATTSITLILKDDQVTGDLNGFYDMSIIRPALTASATATQDNQQNAMTGVDPLVTQLGIYRRYRFKRLAFSYVPKVGTSQSSQIALSFSPTFSPTGGGIANTVSSSFTNDILLQNECSISFPAWQEATLDCTKFLCSDRLMFTNFPLSVGTVIGNSGSCELSPADLSCGTLEASIDGATAGTTYGRLIMSYEIECYVRGALVSADSNPAPILDANATENKVLEEKVDNSTVIVNDDYITVMPKAISNFSVVDSARVNAPHSPVLGRVKGGFPQ